MSTAFTSHVPSRRERDENVQHYGAGGKHEKRNTGKSKNNNNAEMFLRNDGLDERIRKFKETNNFHLISTTFTSHIPSRRERDEHVELYGAGGKQEKRNAGKSKINNKPPKDNPAKAYRGRVPLYAEYIDFKTDKVFGR